MATIGFTNVTGFGSYHPEAPPEMRGAINDFGFPTVLKRLHRGLRSCMNRIPRNDPNSKAPIRDRFLRCIAMDLSSQAEVEKFCSKLGFDSALRDLLEKRITLMTDVDFIVDERLATPNAESVKSMKDELLKEDRERFARVVPVDGKSTNEWDVMDDPNGPSF